MLSVKNLGYRRQDKTILEDLSFDVERGSGLMVTGPNGSGKTTLLRILAGLLEPQEGEIRLDSGDRGEVLYLGHKNAMKEELSVLDNLIFWAGLQGNEILIPVALSYFGLEEYTDYPYKALSLGLQRRVALARLIFPQGIIWLLDEPFASIDRETAEKLENLIKVRAEQGGLVILSSHHPVNLPGFRELRLAE